jgi:hypothetical protein
VADTFHHPALHQNVEAGQQRPSNDMDDQTTCAFRAHRGIELTERSAENGEQLRIRCASLPAALPHA